MTTKKPTFDWWPAPGRSRCFFVRTDDGAERSRIVAINPGKPEKQQWREAVPDGKATLQAANVVNRQATDGPFQLHRKRPNRLAVGEVGLQNRPRG